MKNEQIRRLKEFELFSLHLYESTDVAGLQFFWSLWDTSWKLNRRRTFTGWDARKLRYWRGDFSNHKSFMQKHGFEWRKCIDICSDGMVAMIGKVNGAVSRLKNWAVNTSYSHCVIHRHSLASRKMPEDFKFVLNEAVKIINYVNSRPLQARLLKITAENTIWITIISVAHRSTMTIKKKSF